MNASERNAAVSELINDILDNSACMQVRIFL